MSQRAADELEQRRGLVLGLTLAEVLLLLLFLLLLALGWRMVALRQQVIAHSERAEIQAIELDGLKKAFASLEPLMEELRRRGGLQAESVQSLAVRLVRIGLLEEENTKLKQENFRLTSTLGSVRLIGADPAKLKSLDDVISAAAKINPSDPPQALRQGIEILTQLGPGTRPEDLKDISELHRDGQKVKALGRAIAIGTRINPADPAEAITRAVEVLNKIGADAQPGEVLTMEQQRSVVTQLANARQAIASVTRKGNGLTYPPCWRTEDGKPIYVFDVTIQDDGVVVRDAAPSRANHPDMALVGPLERNVVINENVFRRATQGLRKEGQKNNCVYYSIIRDGTGHTNKKRYKDLVRVVEQNFYPLHRDEPWTESAIGGPLVRPRQ